MLVRRALIVLVLLRLATQGAIAQTPTERPGPNGGAATPKTPDGRPDLQGVWHYATATPLERLAEFADRPFVSEAEAAAWLAKQLATRNNDLRNKENSANDLGREVNEFWWERPAQMARVDGRVMTSLVVDPPNGRVPLLPQTSKAPPPDPNRADNPEDRNPGERCLVHPAGPPMVGGATGGNPYRQVVQTTGYIVLYAEPANTARIVPLGKREHQPGTCASGGEIRWDGGKATP